MRPEVGEQLVRSGPESESTLYWDTIKRFLGSYVPPRMMHHVTKFQNFAPQ